MTVTDLIRDVLDQTDLADPQHLPSVIHKGRRKARRSEVNAWIKRCAS